ncbi:coiled-coil domain-containing protein 194 [Zalophus californianus]|uniref:Coiled-coil domain-containing protein 194 n=1 Tax=Zalophus californianus TaxID=9704 RepID=A0A6P9F6B1_ZALCA|nr:coiled-coil domain-containing protein 194 [Zalophus californianus]
MDFSVLDLKDPFFTIPISPESQDLFTLARHELWKAAWPSWGQSRAARGGLLALCGAAVVPGGRGSRGSPAGLESGLLEPPGDLAARARGQRHGAPADLEPELEELRRRLAEATQQEEALARQLGPGNRVGRELEEALRACQGRQSRLQTQMMILKTEIEEAKAQGTQMGAENGALTDALARWEAAATESARRLDEAQQRARAAEAVAEACAAREAVLRERA